MPVVMFYGGLLDLYKRKEGVQLDKLEKIPAEKIEARAKSEKIWQDGITPHQPAEYDLIQFSSNGKSPQIGIVAGTGKNGAFEIVTKLAPQGAETVREVQPEQIQGVISKPIPKTNDAGADEFVNRLGKALSAHQNLVNIMTGLLTREKNK